MKTTIKILSIIWIMTLTNYCFSQTPEGINYQATVRNSSGALMTNQSVSVVFAIKQNSSTGTTVYQETHSVTTNGYGGFNAVIGAGTSTTGTFSTINWGTSTFYLNVKVNGNDLGTTQLISVPYALYAKSSGSSTPGPQGVQGNTGATGPQGIPGATGPAGATYQWDNIASLNNPNAANPIATPTGTTTYSVTVTSAAGCSSIDQVILGRDAFIFGYPKTIGIQKNPQFDYNKPLLRKGIISGIYKDKRTIILDCASYGGNSGGPVYSFDSKGKIKLVGLVSQYIPHISEYGVNNSSYSVASSAEIINEILNTFRKK